MSIYRTIETIPLDGGRLCFDFVNTVRNRRVAAVHNYLSDYEAFGKWCERLALLPAEQVAGLTAYAAAHPDRAQDAVDSINVVRETLYAFFSAIAAGHSPDLSIITAFNGHLSSALSRLIIVFQDNSYQVTLPVTETELTGPIWLVLKSAYDVMTTDDRQRIKECPECGWLFLDTTKNNRRQWCNPLICGSTSKAKRYYHRKKQANAQDDKVI